MEGDSPSNTDSIQSPKCKDLGESSSPKAVNELTPTNTEKTDMEVVEVHPTSPPRKVDDDIEISDKAFSEVHNLPREASLTDDSNTDDTVPNQGATSSTQISPQSTENSKSDEPQGSSLEDASSLVDTESVKMYAEVASLYASKVNQLKTPTRETSALPSNQKNQSLSLIMSYDSGSNGSSSDEETEKEEVSNNFSVHRYQAISISSGCSSGDERLSDDDGSSSESENECQSEPEETSARPMTGGEKSSEGARAPSKATKKLRELRDPLMLDFLPPIERLAISVPEEDCMPIGKVYSMVDRLLVIESLPKTPALMLDSVIFTRDGSPIGQIFDIFGHVKQPFYSIRFNTAEDIKKLNISVGKVVYCAPKTDHTKYVFTHDLMKQKGSDASWKDDEEVPASCVDYSDDEAELAAINGSKCKKEKDADSPARRRHLSFEQQMNRNNTLRNRAFKRDSHGEARNWDGGWHNYKKNNPQFQQLNCDPPPPPPRQIQPCVYSNPPVNPMNLVIRPPCFNPVIERPPVSFQPPPSAFQITPPPWARFEPPPTPPPRGFQGFPNSPPSNGGAFQRFDPTQAPPSFGITPFTAFTSSPPSPGNVFQSFGSPSRFGPPPNFGQTTPRFSSPPTSQQPQNSHHPQPPIPLQQSVPSRYVSPPPACRPSLTIPPPPFSNGPFPTFRPRNPNNSNNPNSLQPHIPRLPFSSSNNNHPPLYNHPPF